MFLTAFFLSCKYSANAEMPSWQAAVKMSERLQENGKLHEAEQVLLEILRKDPGIEPAGLAYLYNNLGSVCQDERRYVVARRHYQRSIAEWEKAGDAHRMALARTLNNLGSLHWDTGKIAEAERTLMRSASLQIEAVGRDRPEAAPLFYNLGALYLRQKRWEEAASAYRQFVVIEDRRAVEGLETAVATNNLGILYRRMGRQAEADRLFARARSIWERSRGERDAQKLLLDLAKSFWSGNQRTEAALAAMAGDGGRGVPLRPRRSANGADATPLCRDPSADQPQDRGAGSGEEGERHRRRRYARTDIQIDGPRERSDSPVNIQLTPCEPGGPCDIISNMFVPAWVPVRYRGPR